MVKATAPLSPRQVLGNRQPALSIEEASAAVQSAALDRELDAAIDVWISLPLTGARTRKASAYIAALERQRLASLLRTEAANVYTLLTAHEAAAEIVALINSRMDSPRLDELSAIIGKVTPIVTGIPAPTSAPSVMNEIAGAVTQTVKAVAGYDDMNRSERERFGYFETLAQDYQVALERLLVRFEPQTPNDVLTLAYALEKRSMPSRPQPLGYMRP